MELFDKKSLQTLSAVLSKSNNVDAARVLKIVDKALNEVYDLDVIEDDDKDFTLRKQILNDGADCQSQAVLAWLRGHLFNVSEFCYSHKVEDCDVSCVRYENCREQGYIVSVYVAGFEKSLHYAFYEHRNSDSIYIQRFEKPVVPEIGFEPPTKQDVWDNMEDKWSYSAIYSHGEVVKAAEWIVDDMCDTLSLWFPNKN